MAARGIAQRTAIHTAEALRSRASSDSDAYKLLDAAAVILRHSGTDSAETKAAIGLARPMCERFGYPLRE